MASSAFRGLKTQADVDRRVAYFLARESACEQRRDACEYESADYWRWHDEAVAWRNRAVALMPMPGAMERAVALTPRRVGEVTAFTSHGRQFEAKRLSRSTWHLRDVAILSRSRFGTYAEIRADVAAALECGALPGPNGPRW